jgi:DNA-directed RNA polymerase subunit beta'
MKEIPLVINRAPSLHKHNMTGHYAKISGGNTMHIPPEIENGQNADYDGDQLAIHVPFGHKAVADVKNKLMASKQLFTDSTKNGLTMGIDLDPFIGFYDATKGRK